MDLRETWQARADAWIRWARSPELDDDFWQFHLPQFVDLLPPPGGLTVDMGCGEGLHQPLTAYTAAMAASGLVIEAIREPVKTSAGTMTMPFLDLLARLPAA